MRLSPILYGFVIFTVLITAFFTLFIDGANRYGVSYNETYSASYIKMNESLTLSTKIGQKFTNLSQDETNAVSSQTLSSSSALRLMWDSIDLSKEIVSDIARDIQAPPIFTVAFIVILSVAISFTLISLFFRRET